MRYSLLFVLIVCLSSCMKEIPFDGDIKAPKLVVNAVVEMDSTFSVYLERSVFFLSSQNTTDAKITSGAEITVKNLTTNETVVVNQPTLDNRYDFPFITTPHTTYSISVSHPDYPAVSAQTTTLSKIDILSVETHFFPGNNEDRAQITLRFKDPPESNFYMVKGKYLNCWSNYDYIDGQQVPTDTNCYEQIIYIRSSDPSVDNAQNMDIDGYVYPIERLYFSDELFNNQEKVFRFDVSVWGTDEYESLINSLDVELISMNEETFKYFKSAEMNIYNDPVFSEPIKVYSNITNGFGIFGYINYSMVSLGE